MTRSLKVGDVAILHGLTLHTEFNGMQVIIESTPYRGYHAIDFPGHEQWTMAHKRNLKKRPPEPDDAEFRQAMLDCIERAKMGQGVRA